jgi:hypothetical protein
MIVVRDESKVNEVNDEIKQLVEAIKVLFNVERQAI